MRELRFLRRTEHGTHLVVQSPDGGEEFAVAIDAALREATRPEPAQPAAQQQPPAAPARPEPEHSVRVAAPPTTIVPREIQIRVRSGESPEEVAASLGVGLDRIMRFAAAVVEERRRIADEARRARARHTAPEGAESKVIVFGEAVDARFAAHGIDPADVTWNALRREDGEWVVVAEWTGGESRHDATWVFSRGTRTVTPADDTAADLLSDRPIRPLTPPAPSTPRLVAAPPLVPGIVAFPPMPDALTGPVPRIDDVYDQESPADGPRSVPPLAPVAGQFDKSEPESAPEPKPGRERRLEARSQRERKPEPLRSEPDPAETTMELDYDEPPLPLGITEPPAKPSTPTEPAPSRQSGVSRLTNRGANKRDESDEEKAARARVPSWDDILLGVRRKTD